MKERERKIPDDVLNIILRDERVGYTATIKDVSRTGMSVFSDHIFPTYKMIDVLIKIGKQPIQLKGSVRWVKESLPDRGKPYHEIGISLIDPSREYLDYFGFDSD
jgi:Tfp pilus assembly protein PilZ